MGEMILHLIISKSLNFNVIKDLPYLFVTLVGTIKYNQIKNWVKEKKEKEP